MSRAEMSSENQRLFPYQTVIRLQLHLLFFWTNGLINPRHTQQSHSSRPDIFLLRVEEAFSDSYSCFMLPQIKKKVCFRKIMLAWTRARFLTEPVSGSCGSWTKPDYDLLPYLCEMRKHGLNVVSSKQCH